MAPINRRRSRAVEEEEKEEEEEEEEEEEVSRPNTPLSTAPNDGKRARLSSRRADPLSTSDSEDATTSRDQTKTQGTRNGALNFGVSKARPAHQPGAIVRVKLTNFVTYTSAEFYPGPNLNMVIGPNGTGKSTLVCAICLGLGWGTQYLGRAKDVAEFVKHGCREATIEIELQRATSGKAASKANPVITRTIKREGNKSAFTLNGSSTSNKAIVSLAQSFDIQIDNLCQFLPQDKVVEFAQMTPIQILESTQRAAAAPAVLELHQNVKQLREQQKEYMNNSKGDREQLTNLENRQEMQRTEVERLRERAIIQRKLGWLEKCRPIPQFCEAKMKKNAAKERKLVLQRDLTKLQQESAPTLQKVNAKQIYMQQVQTTRHQCKEDVKIAEQECDRIGKEAGKYTAAFTDLKSQFEAEGKTRPKHKQTIAQLNSSIQTLKVKQSTPPEPFDSRAMNKEIQDLNSRKRELEDEKDVLRSKAGPLSDQLRERKALSESLKEDEKRLKTNEGRLEDKLKEMSSDTFQAWQWIKANGNLFKKTVYGPPLIECSVKDPSRASLVEAAIPRGDFKIITTQCREDFNLLQRELTGTKRLHDISLRQCDIDSLDGFQRPMNEAQMQEHGIDGWIIDLLTGPATVVANLCQERNLHQIATASHDVNEEQYNKLQSSAVKGYVTKTVGYQFIRRPEYGQAGNSARDMNMRPKGFWTGQSMDGGRLAENQARRREAEGEAEELKTLITPMKLRHQEIQIELTKIDAEIEKLKAEKDDKQKLLTEFNGLETKINHEQAKILTAQNLVDEVNVRLTNIQTKMDKNMFQQADAALQYVEAVHELQGETQRLLEMEVMLIEAQNDVQTLKARNQKIIDLINEKTKAFDEAVETLRVENEKATRYITKIKKLRDEGELLEEETGEAGLTETLVDISKSENITEKDLDDLIGVEQAKLELTEGGDANTIKEFEERAQKIEGLRVKLTDFAQKQDDFIQAIKEVRSAWEPELDRLVAKISDAFGDSFARIGCSGQVVVFKASSDDPADCTEELGGSENGLDFANWAIHISVKFRENEPLSLLDSHRQSGGERAVSTIFYLMALQSLSRAPFRVVDEINQGMDPRNERMVHGRMVDIAAADENGNGQGSQYFLITPKLLSGLKYKSGMTVLCIVSGENMPNAADSRKRNESGQVVVEPGRKIDFGAFARKARELGMGRSSAGKNGTSRMSHATSFGTLEGSQVTEVGA